MKQINHTSSVYVDGLNQIKIYSLFFGFSLALVAFTSKNRYFFAIGCSEKK
jgi:hypothetical protein